MKFTVKYEINKFYNLAQPTENIIATHSSEISGKTNSIFLHVDSYLVYYIKNVEKKTWRSLNIDLNIISTSSKSGEEDAPVARAVERNYREPVQIDV